MWDNLTPADVERATHRLSMRRAGALKRHSEETKNLDNEEIETFDENRRRICTKVQKLRDRVMPNNVAN